MTDKPCPFCGTMLKGHAEAEFKGQVTFTASCEKCGTYTLTPDLVQALPALDQARRAKVAEFLQVNWEMLGVEQELDLNFVEVQLGT